MDFSELAFPRPGDIKREPEAVHVYADGREIINRLIAAGRRIWNDRLEEMRLRQGERCCLEGYIPQCPGHLRAQEATWEHETPKGHGGGRRDDRIVLPDGRRINGASHYLCNGLKGSRRIEYNDHAR